MTQRTSCGFPPSSKKALRPSSWDERLLPSAVPPVFAQCAHFRAGNGALTVPVSRAAPGRTKGHGAGGLSAGDPPSLGAASSLFSRSTRFAKTTLYHIPPGIARGNGNFPARKTGKIKNPPEVSSGGRRLSKKLPRRNPMKIRHFQGQQPSPRSIAARPTLKMCHRHIFFTLRPRK